MDEAMEKQPLITVYADGMIEIAPDVPLTYPLLTKVIQFLSSLVQQMSITVGSK